MFLLVCLVRWFLDGDNFCLLMEIGSLVNVCRSRMKRLLESRAEVSKSGLEALLNEITYQHELSHLAMCQASLRKEIK